MRDDKLRACFPFAGDTLGGSHLSTLLLMEGLKQEGIEAVAILHRTDGLLAAELRKRGISWITAPAVRIVGNGKLLPQLWGMMAAASPLAACISQERFDLVHVNDLRMQLTWAMAAKLAGAKLIWHQRSTNNSRRLGWYSMLADAKLTISQFCLDRFSPLLAKGFQVIDNPFQTQAPRPDRSLAKARLLLEAGLPPETKIVGFVGNFMARKRPEFFVHCSRVICDRTGEKLFFPIFGEPRSEVKEQVVEAIEQRGVNHVCRIMGERFPIEPWLAACDVLLAPARDEPFGRTLVEAMLVGTPVVASDSGGHREIIKHGVNGLLVPMADVDGHAEAVLSLLRSREMAEQMAEQAYLSAIQRFSVPRHAAEIASLYRKIMYERS